MFPFFKMYFVILLLATPTKHQTYIPSLALESTSKLRISLQNVHRSLHGLAERFKGLNYYYRSFVLLEDVMFVNKSENPSSEANPLIVTDI